jgi:DNA-3-methyladenine glycosylase II
MTHFIHTQADLETAVGVLIKQDPRWQPVFAKSGMPAIRRREGGYAGLCSIVCGQQVSTASAAAIRARLFAAFEPFPPRYGPARARRQARAPRPVATEDQVDQGNRQGRFPESTSISTPSPRWRPTRRTRR